MQVCWLGHASFLLKNGCIIYIDPWNVGSNEQADLILVTHAHYDHCDPATIKRLSTPSTVIVAPPSCKTKLDKRSFPNCHWIKAGEKIKEKEVEIEAAPAYNLHKSFHPKEDQGVGYIVTIGGKRVYHAGDTDFIPEMSSIKSIDVALLPVSGTYVMTAEEAAEAANSFNPKRVIPMHYGSIVGSQNDAIRFKSLTHCEVEIQEKQ